MNPWGPLIFSVILHVGVGTGLFAILPKSTPSPPPSPLEVMLLPTALAAPARPFEGRSRAHSPGKKPPMQKSHSGNVDRKGAPVVAADETLTYPTGPSSTHRRDWILATQSRLQEQVSEAFRNRPVALASNRRLALRLSVDADGSVRSVTLHRASGSPTVDRMTLTTVKKISSLRPPGRAIRIVAPLLIR